MIPQIVVVGGLAAAVANNIALSQTPTSGTPLTLNGALVSGSVAVLDKPRRILLTYGNEGSNRTLVVSGTNHTGNPISETLAVPSGASGTLATLQDFATVTSLVPGGGGWTAAVTVGTNTVASSPWKNLNDTSAPMNFGVGVIGPAGTVYTVEYTYDDPNLMLLVNGIPTAQIPTPWPLGVLNGVSGNKDGSLTAQCKAWRLTINTGTGQVTATGQQAGITQGA